MKWKSWLALMGFRAFQSLGFHITPNHFYYPIPDTRELKSSLWDKRSDLTGVDINETGQLALAKLFIDKYKKEYENLPRDITDTPHQYFIRNDSFAAIDGEIYYCIIRHFKPKRIIEIGSGNTTYLAAQSVLKNEEETGESCELIAIEPYPNEVLRRGFPGLARLICSRLQDVPLSEFDKLIKDDILFIDSSHILSIGSDVQFEYLEIIPRIRAGVIVHMHDIFLPNEYPRQWVLEGLKFWNEQYVLQAFLSFNKSFEVLWSGSWMHLNHPEKLEEFASSYDRRTVWPGSFWMRRLR